MIITDRPTILLAAYKRAEREIGDYRIVLLSYGMWDVTRWNDAERSYNVTCEEYDWTCSCPAFEKNTHCKHIEMVRLRLEEDARIEELEAAHEEMMIGRGFLEGDREDRRVDLLHASGDKR